MQRETSDSYRGVYEQYPACFRSPTEQVFYVFTISVWSNKYSSRHCDESPIYWVSAFFFPVRCDGVNSQKVPAGFFTKMKYDQFWIKHVTLTSAACSSKRKHGVRTRVMRRLRPSKRKNHISITSRHIVFFPSLLLFKSRRPPLFLCSGLTCQSPWLRKCIQSRWKRCSPWTAAPLHLDSSLSESQACSPHCPDSYLGNCLPVREEHKRSWQRRYLPPTSRQETRSNGDSGALGGLLVRCQENCSCRFISLNRVRDPNVVSLGGVCRRL